ncbi:MAG: ExbD/TolR family protein [Hydrogenophaga sp.]|nr:ExbD/TolR family protein [Hydrogenophaga sp.]
MPDVSRRGRGRRTMNEINMVPFIDVMLVLLIIFMVTAPLITPSQISLPSVGQADRTPDVYVEVIIDKTERLQLRMGQDNRPPAEVSARELVRQVQTLRAGAEDMPVLVSADKEVTYNAVMEVVRQLRAAGVNRVALSTL